MNPFLLMPAIVVGMPVPDEAIRMSIVKGLKRLEMAATNYTTHRQCFSCHHQALPMMALASAKERGFAIDEKVVAKQVKFTLDTFTPNVKDIRNGIGIGGANLTAGYALRTLHVSKQIRNETTDALIEFLLKKQKDDGSWPATTVRPPSEESPFTTAALILQALDQFGNGADKEIAPRLAKAREKGLAFIRDRKPKSNEDRVFLIWCLVAGGAGKDEIADAKDDLLDQQRPNGGWAQLDAMSTDAYATGSALVALRLAGGSPKDASYRRGIRNLMLSQSEPGVWIVQTRSRPIQTYFDNGDPGGKSQFISTPATAWAVMALVECVEKR
jgi:N-acyl-D-amino-acid deacylase